MITEAEMLRSTCGIYPLANDPLFTPSVDFDYSCFEIVHTAIGTILISLKVLAAEVMNIS